jgi:hypothetical protein
VRGASLPSSRTGSPTTTIVTSFSMTEHGQPRTSPPPRRSSMRSGTMSWPGYRRSPIRQLSGLDACDEPCSGKDAEDSITGEHGYCYTEDDSDTD